MNDPVPISRENNPFYPLPPDYEELGEGGQREARVNACRLWQLPGTPEERAENRVVSTFFFDTYYLRPDPDAFFDSGFYDQEPLPTPSFHWDLSRMWATNRLNVALAPRGGAKTSHCQKDMALCLITAPRYSFAYATSTHDNARHTGSRVRDICYENSRISDDFCPHFSVDKLRPSRGSKDTGTELFYLANGSWLRCVSVNTRLRGLRPRRFRLDDPEHDAKASTSMQVLRDATETLVFKVALPMVLRANTGLDWVGTFVSKRHLLWHAMLTSDTPDGPRAADPRFDYWARLLIRACHEDPDTGRLTSCWPHMWPSDAAERTALGLTTETLTLPELREKLGTMTFNGEMMGRPGDSEDQYFKLDPSAFGRHSWWFESIDTLLTTDPYSSTASICYRDKDQHFIKKSVPDWLRTVRLFITVDTAFTEKSTSDRRCCCLMAVDPENRLFVLDLWSDRKPDATLVAETFRLASLWRVPAVFVEVVKESYKLYERFQSAVKTKTTEHLALTHVPKIGPLKPGHMDKESKIATLDIRFEHGLIKLPFHARGKNPGINRLFNQIEGFNPEVPGGGLENDDELDCVSMSLFVIKGRLRKQSPTLEALTFDPIAALKKGELNLPNGGPPIMSLFPLDMLDPDILNKMLSDHQTLVTSEKDSRL